MASLSGFIGSRYAKEFDTQFTLLVSLQRLTDDVIVDGESLAWISSATKDASRTQEWQKKRAYNEIAVSP